MLPHFAMVGNRQEPRKLQESAQGTTKRRQEVEGFQLSGMGDEGYPNKIKRPCLEDVTLSMGPGAHPSTACAQLQVPALHMNPSSAAMAAPGHPLLLDNSTRNGSIMGPPFAGPPTAEMGVKGPSIPYYNKTNSVPAMDQELQDLLEELRATEESSQSEVNLEKILGTKPEEPLVLHHQPLATLGATAKPTVQMPRLESLSSSKDFASSCSQVTGVSLQIPPSSAGLSYAVTPASKQMASPSSSTVQAKNQAQATLSAALPPLPVSQWHHAHQLKALAASKQRSSKKQLGPTTSWSALPPPGLSSPYQPVPMVSPQPLPPFSPQGLMVSCMSSSSLTGSTLQGSPNALLSSLAPSSSTVLGPTRPYAPEKFPSSTLQQPPPFSTQTSILANLVSSTIKHPQEHLMSALHTSNTGPLTPYHPETLSSPGLPQQSFTTQCPLIQDLTTSSQPLCQPQPPASAIYKPKTLSTIMQQGLSSPSPGAPEPFPFGHTKPLSHFISEPGPQKMPSVPTTSQQPALLHYLQQPTPPPASSAMASSTATATLQLQQQPDLSSFLLQDVTQQPQRFQRSLASEDSMPSLPRQREKQRSGLMAMTPEQRSSRIAQRMSQFQGVQDQVISNCSRTKPSSPPSQRIIPPRAGLLHSSLSSRMAHPIRQQSQGTMGMLSPIPRRQQGIFNFSPPSPTPSQLGHNPLSSLGSIYQHMGMPRAAPAGVPLPRFYPSPLGSQALGPHQLRQPHMSGMSTMLHSTTWVVAAASLHTQVMRETSPSQAAHGMQQHYDSSAIFAKALVTTSLEAPVFPLQQAVVSPHQVAPEGRPSQMAGPAPAKPSFSLLGNKSVRQSPVQGAMPTPHATKSLPQGMVSFGPESPIQAIEPPSSVAATAATSIVAASQSPSSPCDRTGSPFELSSQSSLDDHISIPDCSEVDFDTFMMDSTESPDEDWMGNLRLISGTVDQAADEGDEAQSAGHVPQNADKL
ncbi:mastermind-like domain-containing protein 1 isoform X2 [Moschus berezovskii]|uniref:mastermind-like domain-containing protein 1 isoform X2 n=1 Tax=Moschus berezovskii TaxID=68408 RepID=UPI0024441EF8|nr:mastermind-like domain-containing protein 1 isoform X2 [Moschus berezovskii]